ncbi:hypothetical protein F5Y18DRAFT_139863 [Xylariaceae sp. FL1019]|nr:hypothetical protein F5Y18DRAFT_139863 [Xylariaceae sp. FL1019]
MRFMPTVFGLAVTATTVAAKFLHYTVPAVLAESASDCVLPADFVVTDFQATFKSNNSIDTVSFGFQDTDTGIDTVCNRNSTSVPTGVSKNQYKCDDATVGFVYQTSWTGITGLTLVERACTGEGSSSEQFEAAGQITPHLDCTNSTTTATCVANETTITGDYDSFEPVPTNAPLRRFRAALKV